MVYAFHVWAETGEMPTHKNIDTPHSPSQPIWLRSNQLSMGHHRGRGGGKLYPLNLRGGSRPWVQDSNLYLQIASSEPALLPAATNSTQNSRNAVLHADILFLGSQVLPLTTAKQNAIIVGVANVLGGGILASDINLTVLSTYNVRLF